MKNIQEYPVQPVYRNGNGHSTNGAMHAPVADVQEEEISLRDLIDILLKGKWFILGAFVLSTTLAVLYTRYQEPTFQASSVIYVDSQQETPQIGELLGFVDSYRNVANEVEIIQSVSSAERVADALLSLSRSALNHNVMTLLEDEDGKALNREEIADEVLGRVKVEPVSEDVDLIRITATSPNPEEAQLIANLYAETYRDYNRKSSRARMTASREFLDEVAGQFSSQLQGAENELTSFLNREKIVEPDEEARQLLQQVSQLQSIQYQTKLELGMAQAELKGLENEIDQITPGLADRISSSDDLMVDRLKQQIANLQVEEQQIFARNPEKRNQTRQGRLLEIQQEVTVLTKKLDDHVGRLVQQAINTKTLQLAPGRDLSTAGSAMSAVQNLRGQITEKDIEISGVQARLDIINDQLDVFKGRLGEIPTKALVLQRLQRSQQSQEQLYLTLLQKMQEARIAERSELGYIDIIDKARKPAFPIGPNLPRNTAMGALFGLMLGVGLAFGRNALDNRIHTPDDLKKHHVSVLAVVTNLKSTIKKVFGGKEFVRVEDHTYSTSLVTLLEPLSPATEEYRLLRTNIEFYRPDAAVKTMVVTSSSPGEGKTLTSFNLAITMAKGGYRTLYIDADLRRPTGHRMLGMMREPGLVELLFEKGDLDLDVYATAIENLSVVPAGREVPNPAELLGSAQMRALLKRLAGEFDLVILDTPPVLSVTDPLILAAVADATLIVCMADETFHYELDRTIERLRDVGARIAGCILNRFNFESHGKYGYKYGYRYMYYGYGENQKKKSRRQKETTEA